MNEVKKMWTRKAMPVDSVVRIVGRHELLAAVADCMRASKSSTVSETND